MKRHAARWGASLMLVMLVGLLLAAPAIAEDALPTYSSLKLNKTALTISPLTTGARFIVTNQQDGYEPITWTLSPSSVADIDPDTGIISPKVKNGTATVKAQTPSGAKAQAKLTVKTIATTSFALNVKTVTVSPGRTFKFKATIKPANATYRDIEWTLTSLSAIQGSQRPSKFDPETLIFTAGSHEVETLILTAKTGQGRTVSARITVKSVPVNSVKFSKSKATASIGNTYDLAKYLTVKPSNAADPSVTWTVSKDEIATIDQDGQLSTLAGGTVRVTATSVSNPAKRAVLTVTVKYVKVKSVALGAANVAADTGDQYLVPATISPSNATHPYLVWQSSNEQVATVSTNGTVKAIGPGIAKITAKAANDSAKATFTFRVRGGNKMSVIKLSAVGDVTLGGDKRRVAKTDPYIGDGMTSYTRFKALYDTPGNKAPYFFQRVSNIFHNDDVTIANIEGTLTNQKSHASKAIVLSGPPEYREILRLGGIDVGSTANNHAYDFGQAGYNNTISNLNNVGVLPIKFNSGGARTMVVNGIRMGFASFQIPVSRAEVQKAIRSLKKAKKCAVVVVSFHWAKSPEWTSNVTTAERSMARFAITCGADLVLGHHKHMVSGIERYKGKMIAYDLGNFISLVRHVDKDGNYVTKDSMIYQQRFHVFEDGYIEVAAPNIIPALNSTSLETFTGQPWVVSGESASRILNAIRARSPSASKDLVQTISGY